MFPFLLSSPLYSQFPLLGRTCIRLDSAMPGGNSVSVKSEHGEVSLKGRIGEERIPELMFDRWREVEPLKVF